jgi:aminoglycoside phosphotransferase (APT) family kinase protein
VERAVYAEVLPRLPLPAPRYYGLVEEGDAWCWLFLEDAGGVKFSPDRAADRALAARWLGCLHTAAAGLAGAPALPDRGPGYYREQMRAARPALLRALGNPALPTGGREVLREVAGLCDTLEAGWPALAACCAGVPATLVHGDFRRKNVLVRADPGGPALFPFDWETAGWGLPAADLAPSRGLPSQIDLPAYWSAVRGHWPGLGQEGVERLARAGIVFRRLAAVAWECARVASPWPQKAVASLRIYHAEIAQTLRELGLGRSDGNAPRGSGADA